MTNGAHSGASKQCRKRGETLLFDRSVGAALLRTCARSASCRHTWTSEKEENPQREAGFGRDRPARDKHGTASGVSLRSTRPAWRVQNVAFNAVKHSVPGISVDGVIFDSHLRRGSLERAVGTESEQNRSESCVFGGPLRTRSHRIRSGSTGPFYIATSEPAENTCFHAGNAKYLKGCLVRLLCIAMHHRRLGGPFRGQFL